MTYWTSHRYSEKVIDSIDKVIDRVKKENKLEKIKIIGFSGGGTVAALLAARRDDIDLLITVAGNLDPDYHCRLYGITPLWGSLNPSELPNKLKHIKQVHFVGGKDQIVPRSVAESYREKISPLPGFLEIVEIKTCSHHDGWHESWGDISRKYL